MNDGDPDLFAELQAERQEYEQSQPYWESLFANEPSGGE